MSAHLLGEIAALRRASLHQHAEVDRLRRLLHRAGLNSDRSIAGIDSAILPPGPELVYENIQLKAKIRRLERELDVERIRSKQFELGQDRHPEEGGVSSDQATSPSTKSTANY